MAIRIIKWKPNFLSGAQKAGQDISTVDIAKGFVNHGAVAGTARPTGYVSVEWLGSVQPTNAVAGDTWIDTTT